MDPTDSSKDRRKLDRMGRRRFISAMAGIGISATALQHITPEILNEYNVDLSEEVPYIARLEHTNHEEIVDERAPPEREEIWKKMSREEWNLIRTAENATQKVRQIVDQFEDSNMISPAFPTNGSQHELGSRVTVEYYHHKTETGKESPEVPPEKVREVLPDTVTGVAAQAEREIPVVLKEKTVSLGTSCKQWYYNDNYQEDIPGGAKFETTFCGRCTTTTPAYSDDIDKYVMITAGHCLDNTEYIYQPSCTFNGDGKREEWYAEDFEDDYGEFKAVDGLLGDEYYAYQLADEDPNESPAYKDNRAISGIVQEYDIAKNSEIIKQGARTGTITGKATSIDTQAGILKTDIDMYNNDSGGPFYKEEYDSTDGFYNVLICGVASFFDGSDSCPGTNAKGNTATRFELNLNVTV